MVAVGVAVAVVVAVAVGVGVAVVVAAGVVVVVAAGVAVGVPAPVRRWMMTAPRVTTIKLRPWQADAYGRAAELAGLSRNAWITAWCNYAAGLTTTHPRRRVVKPPRDIGERTRGNMTTISVKAPVGNVEAWGAGASRAVLSRQQWVLSVLDAACGVSDLGRVLERVRVGR